MAHRIVILIIKELRALLKDPQSRAFLIAPVVFQLLVFSFAATLEVKNNTLGVYNEDGGAASIELLQRLSRAKAFTNVKYLYSEADLRKAVEGQQVLLVLRFDQTFSKKVAAGQPATIQAVLDGRRSNSGQIALGYVRQILQGYLDDLKGTARVGSPEIIVRHWFNPNLDYVRHIIPSLVAIITTISTLVVTSLSIAREREHGTFDQLLVSPLTPGMIMVGKTVPALFVAIFQGSIIVLAGIFVFGIPFRGPILLLYGCMFFYILAVSGIGLLISSVCSTQQQAFLGVFTFMMPAVLLSGFPSPVENMPLWLQRLDWFNPLVHFIIIVKGVFLKDAPAQIILQSLWPLIMISLITLSAANWMFRRRLG